MSKSIEQTVEELKEEKNPILKYASEENLQKLLDVAKNRGYFILCEKIEAEIERRKAKR